MLGEGFTISGLEDLVHFLTVGVDDWNVLHGLLGASGVHGSENFRRKGLGNLVNLNLNTLDLFGSAINKCISFAQSITGGETLPFSDSVSHGPGMCVEGIENYNNFCLLAFHLSLVDGNCLRVLASTVIKKDRKKSCFILFVVEGSATIRRNLSG